MRSGNLIVPILAASLALVGCSKAAKAPPPTTVAADAKTGDTYPLKACKDIGAPIPPAGQMPYTITLGSSFELRNAVVTISSNGQGPFPGGPNHKHKTTLDIVTTLNSPSMPASAYIEIDLKDKTLHFLQADTGSAQQVAVMGSSLNAQSVFCDVTFDTTDPTDPRWVRFITFPAGSNTSASYNLALTADQKGGKAPPLPVIIDPWTDNDGFVSMRAK